MQELENNKFDFFQSSTKHINKVTEKLNKKPFLKTLFISSVIAASLGAGIGFSHYFIKNYYYQNYIISNNELAILQKVSNKNIQGFFNYLKHNATIYDDLAYFTQETLNKAHSKHYIAALSPSSRNKELSKKLTAFKSEIEEVNNLTNKIFSMNIKEDIDKNFAKSEINLFFKYYNNYLATFYTRNVELENHINESLNLDYSGNIKYNEKNNVHEIAQSLYRKINNPTL